MNILVTSIGDAYAADIAVFKGEDGYLRTTGLKLDEQIFFKVINDE